MNLDIVDTESLSPDESILEDSPLYRLLGTRRIPVNSYHHQAINKLADSLTVMAVSTDGIVEAVCMPGHRFLWAVQWHPEFSFQNDENSRKIFHAFVDAARKRYDEA